MRPEKAVQDWVMRNMNALSPTSVILLAVGSPGIFVMRNKMLRGGDLMC